MEVCNCSMFCCTLLYVHSSFAIILKGKRKLVALLSLSSWCLVIVVWLFLAVPWVCLQFGIVVLSDHTHLIFLTGTIEYFITISMYCIVHQQCEIRRNLSSRLLCFNSFFADCNVHVLTPHLLLNNACKSVIYQVRLLHITY